MHIACDITLSEDSSYIIMKHSGIINRNIGITYNIEAHKLGKRHGINKYLVDLTEAKNNDTFIDKYYFAYNDMNKSPEIDSKAIVSLLVAPDDHSHDFIEKIVKKIFVYVKIFSCRKNAVEYLYSVKACPDLHHYTKTIKDLPHLVSGESFRIGKKNYEFQCDLCGGINFRYNNKNQGSSIQCLKCGNSYPEKVFSDFNREKQPDLSDSSHKQSNIDLPHYFNVNEMKYYIS